MEARTNPGSDGSRYHITGIDRCVIGGFHGPNTLVHKMTSCDLCGTTVCVEHRGIHWERTHKRLDIGSVGFGETSSKEPIGDERIKLLRLFYQGHKLPDDMPATARNPLRRIDRTMVNWDTAGERVTRNQD